MATTLVYEIARFGVRTDAEVLTEHAQVISRDGALWRRVDDGPETRCTDSDVTAVIATDPLLSEVRANEVTRIKAEPAALCELPFGLQVPGDGCDYDESLWSEAMKHEHLEYVAGTDTSCSMRNCGGRWLRWTAHKKWLGCTDAYSNTVTVATTRPWPTALVRHFHQPRNAITFGPWAAQ